MVSVPSWNFNFRPPSSRFSNDVSFLLNWITPSGTFPSSADCKRVLRARIAPRESAPEFSGFSTMWRTFPV